MDASAQPCRVIGRDISKGERAEADLDAFISKRHQSRVAQTGRERDEEAAWAESARRLAAKQAEGTRIGLANWYRHLQNVYATRSEEYGRVAENYERGTA